MFDVFWLKNDLNCLIQSLSSLKIGLIIMLFLSGGTGTPKLIRGYKTVYGEEDLSVVANTADDIVVSGNLVCPDLDTIMYTLAGLIDDDRWWGIKDDSFHTHEFLNDLGQSEYMNIGDMDRAVHIRRTQLLRMMSLSEATEKISSILGVNSNVIPMTNDDVRTKIFSGESKLKFQEWLVKENCEPAVDKVVFEGIEDAKPSTKFIDAVEENDTVVIGPSNPITSIKPIISLNGIKEMLWDKKIILVSPFINKKPFSGPADKLMKACGYEASQQGLIDLYGNLVDVFVVDKRTIDPPHSCVVLDTYMKTREDEKRLAREITGLI